jgi:hypothetical protein
MILYQRHNQVLLTCLVETIQKYYLWNSHYLCKTFVNHVNRICHNQIKE